MTHPRSFPAPCGSAAAGEGPGDADTGAPFPRESPPGEGLAPRAQGAHLRRSPAQLRGQPPPPRQPLIPLRSAQPAPAPSFTCRGRPSLRSRLPLPPRRRRPWEPPPGGESWAEGQREPGLCGVRPGSAGSGPAQPPLGSAGAACAERCRRPPPRVYVHRHSITEPRSSSRTYHPTPPCQPGHSTECRLVFP